MMWSAERSLERLRRALRGEEPTFRGEPTEDVVCREVFETIAPPSRARIKNGHPSKIRLPARYALNSSKACTLIAIQNVLYLSDHSVELPALHINASCTDQTGRSSFRHALETLMAYAKTPLASLPKSAWIADFRYFKVVEGERAVETIRRLHEQNLPFCFLYQNHAYCATNRRLLTPEGRVDENYVYAFNANDTDSTVSRFMLSTLFDAYRRPPYYDMLYVDDLEPPLDVPGRYTWNERGNLFDYDEET